MTQSFSCSACGAPNLPAAGQARMACAYCGANLTIPEDLRIKAKPAMKPQAARAAATPTFEHEAADLLRKAQPIAVKAWNAYALWTWVRPLLPACLVVVVIGFVVCALLGVLPFFLF